MVALSLLLTAALVFSACHSDEELPPQQFIVTYMATTGGSIVGNLNQTIEKGKNGTEVKAMPDTGYRFVKWSDNVIAAIRTEINVTADMSVTAEFEKNNYTLTYKTDNGGSITGNLWQKVTYGGSAEAVKAVPDIGYRFVKWSDGNTNAERQDENVVSDLSLTACFELRQIIVKYIPLTGGTIEGNADQTVPYGGDAENVTAVPDEGYVFIKWSDGNTNAARQDTEIIRTLGVMAFFEKMVCLVKYSAETGGTLYGTANQTVEYGGFSELVTVMPLPNAGYIFDGWSDGVQQQSRSDLIKNDLIVTANFRQIYSQGKGLPSDPYLIYTYQNLIDMIYFPANYYKLMDDLDLYGIAHKPIFNGGLEFFDGNFDGNGKTISNMKVDIYHAYPSLFGCIFLGSVKNLNIIDFEIIVPNYNTAAGALFVGAVCGDIRGPLADVNVSGKITAARLDYDYIAIGGMVGRTQNTLSNCYANIEIELDNVSAGNGWGTISFLVGGLAGWSTGMEGFVRTNLISCSANGNIDVSFTLNYYNRTIGGLVGYMEYYEYVPPEINLSGSGIIGILPSAIKIVPETFPCGVFINDCHTTVDISCNGFSYIGGLIANITSNLPLNIFDCYTMGNIINDDGANIGGFLSYIFTGGGLITNCYAMGDIRGGVGGGFVYWIDGSMSFIDEKNYIFSMLDISYCYTTGNLNCYVGAGFAYEVHNANLYRCYATGDVQHLEMGGGAGFIRSILNTTYNVGIVEECFSTGDVTGYSEAAGFILSIVCSNIKNCYSTSDVYIMRTDFQPSIYHAEYCGFVYNIWDEVTNCYYAGKIYRLVDYPYIGILATYLIGGGNMENCHYLETEDIFGNVPAILTLQGSADYYAYNDITLMYNLAGILNGDKGDSVWMDITSDTPQLKFMYEGGGA